MKRTLAPHHGHWCAMNTLLRHRYLSFAGSAPALAPYAALRRHISSTSTPPRPGSTNAPLIGVAAALASSSPSKPRLFESFSLADRVAVVSGGNRGLGLEMALALAEAGARVYALDLPASPGEEFKAVARYVEGFETGARLEYVAGGLDVTNQKMTWKKVEEIGDKEGRVDVGIAAAGIMYGAPALEHQGEDFQKVGSRSEHVEACSCSQVFRSWTSIPMGCCIRHRRSDDKWNGSSYPGASS